jgi:hypothetical protein
LADAALLSGALVHETSLFHFEIAENKYLATGISYREVQSCGIWDLAALRITWAA